jgi:hypothetical protein
MNALQGEFNALYQRYQALELEMQRQQEYLATLNKIGTITSIIQNGIQAGKIFSSDGKAAKGNELTGTGKASETAEWVERKVKISGEEITIIERRMRIQFPEIKKRDEAKGKIYENDGVPIPKRDPLRYPIIPKS